MDELSLHDIVVFAMRFNDATQRVPRMHYVYNTNHNKMHSFRTFPTHNRLLSFRDVEI